MNIRQEELMNNDIFVGTWPVTCRVLSQKHLGAGLSLRQDEDALYLFKNGKLVSSFSIHCPVESILSEADSQLPIPGVELVGGDRCGA